MFVIGTAGHVDHGKSTLVKALTGIDPDRLREEKERGMTIDLGFAWLTLPSGREVSIVDVPGHERFIKNMLAGVGGIDLALLVIASDESVMPQTKEHLAILDLLQVKRGIVALTKRDLVEQDWLDLVAAEVEETLQGTSLEGAPILPVSSVTRQGLPELLAAIDAALDVTTPRRDTGRPRLPIDRSFVISGFGSVVTGTLTDGQLRVGQEVELVLAGKRARIRGLQTHRKSEDVALPGTRTAVNLSGVSHDEVNRGDVLTIPGWLKPTEAVDVRLRLVGDAVRPLKHNAPVTFHTGASEALARVRLLDRDEMPPGETGWAQIHLSEAVAVAKGDFFVIRAGDATLGGGVILDAHAKRHRRFHAPTLERLATLEKGSPEELLVQALESWGPLDLPSLAERANLALGEARENAQAMLERGALVSLGGDAPQPGVLLLPASVWSQVAERAKAALAAYHKQNPLRRGQPKEELRGKLGLEGQASAPAMQRLVKEGVVVEEETLVRLPEHRIAVTPEQRRRLDEYVRLLESEPFSPPTAEPPAPDLLNVLIEEGKVVKVSDSVVFAAQAYQQMVDRVMAHLKAEGKITVAQVRDMFGASRKYALALMEHLDQKRVTRRVGDERVLR
ncbi:MAG: selenocysteine-specific translation elongation factor [Chloroflexi bacterium]|nr:selenocysteine-specific translation elongation factor [Chloroflexota bacterium]